MDKNILSPVGAFAYSLAVAAKSATGRRNPCFISATTDAPCVFFYVATNATARHFMVWCLVSGTGSNRSFLHLSLHYATLSMVAQAGQSSGWPVSEIAGIPTPVWAIAINERRNSGDSNDCYISEVAFMVTTPTYSHPQFTWLFLAVRRSDTSDRPHREEVTAHDYNTARSLIARDFVAAFAGRIPVQGVTHV